MPSGNHLSFSDKDRIIRVLRESELTLEEIAFELGLSMCKIHKINKEYKIRRYQTRGTWLVGDRLVDTRERT